MSKKSKSVDYNEYLNLFTETLSTFGWLAEQTKEDENDLGKGMRLVSIFEVMPELLENEELMKDIGSTNGYSFLFKEGKQVSDLVFRLGGISNGFKKGEYSNLIVYYNFFEKVVESDYGRTWGIHVLVDLAGKIVLKEQGLGKYPTYIKGVIGNIENSYYDLRTSSLIIIGDSSIQCEEFLFVQKKYNFEWYGGKDKPLGVYKICFETAEVEYFK